MQLSSIGKCAGDLLDLLYDNNVVNLKLRQGRFNLTFSEGVVQRNRLWLQHNDSGFFPIVSRIGLAC